MKQCFLAFLLSLCLPLLAFSQPLPVNEAFQVTGEVHDPNTLLVSWTIKPGYFLYKSRFQFLKNEDFNFTIGKVPFPKAQIKRTKTDLSFEVYRHSIKLFIPVLATTPGESFLTIRYQGCSDEGFCYPPEQVRFKLSFSDSLSLFQVAKEKGSITNVTPNNEIADLFSANNSVFIIMSFLGFGLLLSFTPCVLPMIPVLSGLIVGHGKALSTKKAFFLSLSYVLSMSITYAVAGAIVSLMGHNLQAAMQSPWIISLFSLLFILLALSMFGYYDLRLPLSWQNALARITRSHAGGDYLGAAVMGCLSTLILSPCVTAPLIGALGYIAQTGNVLFGTLALFSLGLGMGIPLLLIGTSAGKILPKAGQWMNEVKSFFGLLLLALAIYLMERILPALSVMVLWGSLLIFSGIYLGALTRSVTKFEKFNQALGIICLLYGLLILIGASKGNSHPLQPLASEPSKAEGLRESIHIATSLTEVKRIVANNKGKPVLLDFYADWCIACKVFEAATMQEPAVQKLLHNFLVVKVDVTANDAKAKTLLKYFDVIAPPTFLFINAQGKELTSLKAVGELSTDAFINHLTEALISTSSPNSAPTPSGEKEVNF